MAIIEWLDLGWVLGACGGTRGLLNYCTGDYKIKILLHDPPLHGHRANLGYRLFLVLI